MSAVEDQNLANQAAIEQTTTDPRGPQATAELGTGAYFEQPIAGRRP
jgi:hypothetical protein